jgi:hypothetical protein
MRKEVMKSSAIRRNGIRFVFSAAKPTVSFLPVAMATLGDFDVNAVQLARQDSESNSLIS